MNISTTTIRARKMQPPVNTVGLADDYYIGSHTNPMEGMEGF